MRVFLTGATGFLGQALARALGKDGHETVAWVRSPERARARLGEQPELVPIDADDGALRGALQRCDAVVNLAGAPILSRWTAARRAELRVSRVELTARLVAALEGLAPRPRVLVSGSAVGLYGDRGDEVLTEASSPGSGFLPRLCVDWEEAAMRAGTFRVRVVLVRTGIVLGREGGALPKMLPPFRMGVGGPLGSGRQFMPWIHVADWGSLVMTALGDERWSGPFDATAPGPVTNREFTRTLARVLHRPAFLPVPPLALRILFGGAASLLLESQRVLPERALALGFRHAHPQLEGALRDLLGARRPAELAGTRGR